MLFGIIKNIFSAGLTVQVLVQAIFIAYTGFFHFKKPAGILRNINIFSLLTDNNCGFFILTIKGHKS